MLVLTRKRGEVVRIGDNVVLKVIKTGRGCVKIGIEAPADVRIVRGELAPLETELLEEADDEAAPLSRHVVDLLRPAV